MSASLDPLAAVCKALDTVRENKTIPPGARGVLNSAIDHLREIGAPEDHRRVVEGLAVAMLKLEWALNKRDEPGVARLQEVLLDLHEAWRDGPARLAA